MSIQGIFLQCIQGTVLTLFSPLRARCPLNRGTTVSNASISSNNQRMHFSALKFQDFLGKKAQEEDHPGKGGLTGPLLIQLFTVSILTSQLLETTDFR